MSSPAEKRTFRPEGLAQHFFSCRCFFRLTLDGLSKRGTSRSLDFVKLKEVSYETFIRYQNDMEDLLPEREGCEKDSNIDSDDD